MILDQAIDHQALQKLTDEEKIDLARKAFAEYLSIAHDVSEKQKHILEKALSNLQTKKIDELRQYIQNNFQ